MAKPRRKLRRLFIEEVATVGLVDKGDDPLARIVFLKKRGRSEEEVEKARNLALERALADLRDLTDQWMAARAGVPGPIARDVGLARVLAANPALHRKIEQLAAKDSLHKFARLPLRAMKRKSADEAVAALSKALAPGDPRLGIKLCERHFPALMNRWRGLED